MLAHRLRKGIQSKSGSRSSACHSAHTVTNGKQSDSGENFVDTEAVLIFCAANADVGFSVEFHENTFLRAK
jgi:hypothetical protein